MREIQATVGTLENMGADFIAAWGHVTDGSSDAPVEAVYFETASDLYRVLSPKRLELLCHLRSTEAMSVFALAKCLRRNYKNVHGDVKILERHGLIEREGDKITAPYDVIHADFDLRKAA